MKDHKVNYHREAGWNGNTAMLPASHTTYVALLIQLMLWDTVRRHSEDMNFLIVDFPASRSVRCKYLITIEETNHNCTKLLQKQSCVSALSQKRQHKGCSASQNPAKLQFERRSRRKSIERPILKPAP